MCRAYPACAPEVKLAGGRFAEIGIDEAVTDGNLVTAAGLAGAPDVAVAIPGRPRQGTGPRRVAATSSR